MDKYLIYKEITSCWHLARLAFAEVLVGAVSVERSVDRSPHQFALSSAKQLAVWHNQMATNPLAKQLQLQQFASGHSNNRIEQNKLINERTRHTQKHTCTASSTWWSRRLIEGNKKATKFSNGSSKCRQRSGRSAWSLGYQSDVPTRAATRTRAPGKISSRKRGCSPRPRRRSFRRRPSPECTVQLAPGLGRPREQEAAPALAA